jgi:hypothetical protein
VVEEPTGMPLAGAPMFRQEVQYGRIQREVAGSVRPPATLRINPSLYRAPGVTRISGNAAV